MLRMSKIIVGAAGLAVLTACAQPSGKGTEAGARPSDQQVCQSAVRERAASSSATVLSYETSEANNLAMIRDQYGVTWRCLVNNGSVVELTSEAGGAGAGTGQSGSAGGVIPPEDMIDECIRQVRVGQPDARITTRDPIVAGPDSRVFVGMTVDGASWGCRIEDNGSYTAFPNFAN